MKFRYLSPYLIDLFVLFGLYYILRNKDIRVRAILVLLIIFVLFFMRWKSIPSDLVHQKDTIYSPAHGTIVKIIDNGDIYTIVISLQITDIHYQYVPIKSKVKKQVYHPGKFYIASILEKSDHNENLATTFIIDPNPNNYKFVVVKQIAGVIARTIRSFINVGENVNVGDIMGMIKYGSRVDIDIPKRFYKLSPQCKVGNKVEGGITPLTTSINNNLVL